MPPLRPLTLQHIHLPRPALPLPPSPGTLACRLVPPPRTTLNLSTRTFTSTSARRLGGAHYDPPTGWLFGVKPGEKYQNEGWEHIYIWGMFGGFGVLAVGYAFKPDTSIQTWALEEARRRLEAEGILKEPEDKP